MLALQPRRIIHPRLRLKLVKSAVDFSKRSEYQLRQQIGMPPAYEIPPDVYFDAGIPTIGGVPLPPIGLTLQQLVLAPPQQQRDETPAANYDASGFADSGQIPFVLAAGQSLRILLRPSNTRVQLTIQNQAAANLINYNFDKQADATNIAIPAGGNRVWDGGTVPQGDLWIFSAAGAAGVIEFMNKNLLQG